MQENANEPSKNLTELVKNVLLGFCKINVQYAERLDICGSVHIRADNRDIANFMLNEHFYSSRASSPTVTSAQPVDQELGGNDGNLQDGDGSGRSLEKDAVKTEMSTETEENHSWRWSDTGLATAQRQQESFLQPSCTTSQPLSAWSSTSISRDSGAESKYFVTGAVSVVGSCVKQEGLGTEAALRSSQFSNGDVVEILDDDDSDNCREDTDYINNDVDDDSEYKPVLFKTEEDYQAGMPFGYDNFGQYDGSSALPYQYSNTPTDNYSRKQPHAAYSAKRFKSGASPVTPGTSEKACEYCQETFASNAQLSMHYLQYHQCPMPPVNPRLRKRKTRVHQIDQSPSIHLVGGSDETVVQMFKCRFCDQMFKSRDGLRNHDNVKHSRAKRYQCSFCSQEFLTRQSAYVHRVKFHRLLVRKNLYSAE